MKTSPPAARPVPPLTRRAFLHASLGAGVGTTALAVVGCTTGSPQPGAQQPLPSELPAVTLKVSDAGPYQALPDAKTRKEKPDQEIYASVLEGWLTDNPAVKLEAVNVDVWTKDAMLTAIAGGTAPAIYYANVIGGWNTEGVKQAFAQQLAADTTDLVGRFDMINRMTPAAREVWQRSWQLDQRSFGAPLTFSVGEVVHYRRDLVAELGLEEPKAGWTWADLRALAKALNGPGHKGIMLRTGVMNTSFTVAEGATELGELPNPDGPWLWRYDYTTRADDFAAAVANLRGMIFEDRSALADIGTGDDPWAPRQKFNRGEIAVQLNSADMLLQGPNAPDGPMALAEKLGKPLDEVTGIAPLPAGLNGHAGPSSGENILQVAAFDPELSDDGLLAAFSLQMYMVTDGNLQRGEAQYAKAQDAASVWQGGRAYPVFTEVTDGLPGSLAEGWGTKIAAEIDAIAALPQRPQPGSFIPVEQNAGPGDAAVNDATSKWWYERATPDVLADLTRLGEVRNQQAASFTSSVGRDEFVAGAKAYYDALGTHWRDHAPDFHSTVFQPWYDQHVKPVLG